MASLTASNANDGGKIAQGVIQNHADGDSSDASSSDDESYAGSESMEELNETLKDGFNAEMEDLTQKRDHASVGVLLLQWEPEDKGFMDTRAEVESLRHVFQNSYNFSTHVKSLNTRRNAEHQIRAHISQFILEEDEERALLIVYYAGHGLKGKGKKKGKLVLQGGNPRKDKKKPASQILWDEVEQSLERAKADLLVIFDCCYAGLLADDDNRSAPPSRIFEYLGATERNSTARGPGSESFTTALVWSLQELVKKADGFTTHELWAKIRKAPGFCEINQTPVYSSRGKNSSLYRLRIRPTTAQENPLPIFSGSDVSLKTTTKPAFLDLQFAFDRPPNKNHVLVLAQSIKKAVKYHNVPIKDVRWQRLSDSPAPAVPALQEDLAKAEVKLSLREVAVAQVIARRWRRGTILPSPVTDKSSSRLQSKEGRADADPQAIQTIKLPRRAVESQPGHASQSAKIHKERTVTLQRVVQLFHQRSRARYLLTTLFGCGAILYCASFILISGYSV